jgi:signal transduction histidine kinase
VALPAKVKQYAAAIGVAGVLCFAGWTAVWPGGLVPDGVAPSGVVIRSALPLILLGLAILALTFPLVLSRSQTITLVPTVEFASLLLFGPPVAMVVAGVAYVVANVYFVMHGKRDVWNVAFNTGNSVLGIGAAGVVCFGVGQPTTPDLNDPGALLRVIVAGAVLYAVDSASVAVAVGLQHRESPLSIWLRSARMEVPVSGALLALGLLTALVAQQYLWVTGLIAVPATVLYLSLKRTLRLLASERAARQEAETMRDRAHRLAGENERLYQAEHAARTEAEQAVMIRGEFLSVAAHELRTPVTSLRGYVQHLLRVQSLGREIDAARLGRALATIDQQSDKLTRLVNQLLDISRIQSGTLELDRQPTDLVALVSGAVALAQPHCEQPLVVKSDGPVQALLDPLRLEQVLTNLIDNAVKYSVDTSPIEITIASASPGAVEIAVRDWGIGIPPEHRQHVFDRFFQAEGSRHAGGMGLGLYISRQIVQAHQGEIAVEAPSDGGTRFVITLPEAAPPVGRGDRGPDAAGAPGGAGAAGDRTAIDHAA